VIVAAASAGYLIGSIPTAVWLGRLWGVDLRRAGTGNPGANNARRLGGWTLALLVLAVEMAKGLAVVLAVLAVYGEAGAVAAGLGAVTGNVYNVWYGFKGGKGLGITGGVLLGLWPAAFPFVVITIAVASVLTRSTGIGTLVTQGFLLVGALAWDRTGLAGPWGVGDYALLLPLVIGICLIIAPKHWRDARGRLSSPARS
jgi:glycerol-3-phosphate acyltransferase PlsY